MSVLFVADFYNDQINGGGENNDAVLIKDLLSRDIVVERAYTRNLEKADLDSCDTIIISNFVLLSPQIKNYISDNCDYIIYEHDHKYVSGRDPAKFSNFKIPSANLINVDFYRNARKVVVLSQICQEVMEKNLHNTNIHSIGTSLWSREKLDFLKNTPQDKTKEIAVVKSDNPTKGTVSAVKFCNDRNLKFEFISSNDQYEFLRTLSQFKTLVFIPQVLETFCRLVAEAKMLGCDVYTKKTLIGFMSEPFCDQIGEQLVGTLEIKVQEALDYFYDLVKR